MKLTPLLLASALPTLALTTAVLASDHKEAPIIREDPTADIADVYAFLSPNDPSMLVLAMTVNPFSAPSEAFAFKFSPNVRYRFNVDNDGDAIADETIVLTFRDGSPQMFLAELPGGVQVVGDATIPTVEPTANAPVINTGPGGIKVFAGPRDDPFFFDVVGFNRFLAGTGGFSGSDGFAGYNCSTIVVELPVAMVAGGSSQLQVWGDTARRHITVRRATNGRLERHVGEWEQVDRAGNPAVNTALLPGDQKDLYNIGLPQNDAPDFAGPIVASLQSLGTDATNIGILASVAVPDTLKLDLGQPIGYPNGRDLDDDVIDTLLFFIFNQTSVPDGVPTNDRPFLPVFPYLADPFQPL